MKVVEARRPTVNNPDGEKLDDGCSCVVVSLFSLVHHTLRHTREPLYISYDDSSHSEWALDFLLGRSTTGVACFIPS